MAVDDSIILTAKNEDGTVTFYIKDLNGSKPIY